MPRRRSRALSPLRILEVASAVSLLVFVGSVSQAASDLTTTGVTASPSALRSSYSWTEIAPPSSFVNSFISNMAWDPVLGYEIVLAGGSTYALEGPKVTGATYPMWVNLNIPLPKYTFTISPGPYLVYDHNEHTMVLLVAAQNYPLYNVSVWVLGGKGWTGVKASNPPGSSYDNEPQVIYDPADGSLLLYGSAFNNPDGLECSNLMYGFHNTSWSQRKSFPGAGGCGGGYWTYDPALKAILYAVGPYWTFSNHTWAKIFPTPSPPASSVYLMSYDPALHGVVAFSYTQSDSPGNVWLWPDRTGGFINITAETSNPANMCWTTAENPIFVNYDPALGGLVCQGTNGGLWVFS
jgi:hypothetical protein